jgi:hypothetical protein
MTQTVIRSGERHTVHLAAYHVLTVTASASGSGSVLTLGDNDTPPTATHAIAASGVRTYGPFGTPKKFSVVAAESSLTIADEPFDLRTAVLALFGDGEEGDVLTRAADGGAEWVTPEVPE